MRNKLIRRQWLYLGITAGILLLFFLTAWQIYETFYPLARPIYLPEVTSITVTRLESSELKITDRESINKIMSTLYAAKPTRKWTVNDFPTVPLYGRMDLHCSEGITTVFYYREQGVWYAEQPYQGIYEIPYPEWEEPA